MGHTQTCKGMHTTQGCTNQTSNTPIKGKKMYKKFQISIKKNKTIMEHETQLKDKQGFREIGEPDCKIIKTYTKHCSSM